MKCIDRSSIQVVDVLDACINGIVQEALKTRFANAKSKLLEQFKAYEIQAGLGTLFSFDASDHGIESQVVIAGLKKQELTKLYTDQMVKAEKPGRKYYDSLMMLAHFGKCPYCGFGQASTLDHFLPKARYPTFSVLGFNLVPSCTDCNRGKGFSVLSQDKQVLHPYFEDTAVEATPWLFSNIIESTPATVHYFVQPPTDWPAPLKRRITNHFNDFDLARRFAIEAASEIAGLSHHLEELRTPEIRREHLSTKARAERRNRPNSWQAALYDALASSAWYQESGFRYG